MSTLELHFTDGERNELLRTVFKSRLTGATVTGVRGTLVPAGLIPFKWGATIHALSIFFVKAALIENDDDLLRPVLQGRKNCPAASISWLISRRPDIAITDLFGTDSSGRTLLHRIFNILNPRLRVSGPTQIFIRPHALHPSNIKIFIEDTEVTGFPTKIRALLKGLEKTWTNGAISAGLGTEDKVYAVGGK